MTRPAYAHDLDALRGKRTCSHHPSSELDTPRSWFTQSVETIATGDFTAAAKRVMAGDHPSHLCWACDGMANYHCHVIANEDSQVRASCLFLLFYTNPRLLGRKVGAGWCFPSWL